MRAGARLAAPETAVFVAAVDAVATLPAPTAGRTGRRCYRPLRRLAAGTDFDVWDAAANGRRYVLKRPAAGRGRAVQHRLDQEWRIGMALDHPSILRPVDWLDSGPAIVFEYLPGGDLTALAGAPVARWAGPLLDVLAALDYLHGLGIVHRDVKARNVLLDDADRGYLIDLGSCMAAGSRWRTGGTTAGHRPQSAPAAVTCSDDVFAFAALVDELLTPDRGAPPVPADGASDRLARLVTEVREGRDCAADEKLHQFGLVLKSASGRSD